jgi:hypothetical protein
LEKSSGGKKKGDKREKEKKIKSIGDKRICP